MNQIMIVNMLYAFSFNFIFSILFSDIIILMIKQDDSRIMEEMRIMWSIRGWNGGSNGDSYDEEIFDVHILSDFLKVKFIGVLFRDMYS